MNLRLLSSLLILSACAQPVRRDAPPTEPVAAKAAEVALPPGTIRKHVWILGFRMAQTPEALPEGLKNAAVSRVLQQSLVKTFSKPSSPFVADPVTNSEEKPGVDSASPDQEIQRFAHDAGGGAFLKGEVSDVRLETKDAPEGLLRAQTNELRITVNFELYDSLSGHKLYSGTAYEVRSESQSHMFSSDNPLLEDADAKLEQMSNALANKILNKVSSLADRVGWRARVVRLDGSRIFINSGRRTGIETGDILRVVDSPREIVDPQTGDKVGEAPGRLKATLRVIQNFGLDGSVAVLQSGGGVGVGDQVELN